MRRKSTGLYVPKTHWLVYAENGVAPMCRKPSGLYVVKSDTWRQSCHHAQCSDIMDTKTLAAAAFQRGGGSVGQQIGTNRLGGPDQGQSL
jgi:hypothetical protein